MHLKSKTQWHHSNDILPILLCFLADVVILILQGVTFVTTVRGLDLLLLEVLQGGVLHHFTLLLDAILGLQLTVLRKGL